MKFIKSLGKHFRRKKKGSYSDKMMRPEFSYCNGHCHDTDDKYKKDNKLNTL